MATKKRAPRGSSVQEWFDEEEARSPGFIASLDEANLRERIATDLRKLREAAGLTQAQLGEKLKIKQPVIARIEAGQSMPDLMTVHRYAHALGYLAVVGFKPQPGLRQRRQCPPGVHSAHATYLRPQRRHQ